MAKADAILIDLELRGLIQRSKSLNGEDSYTLTEKGREEAARILSSLPVEHFTVIGMLMGQLITEASITFKHP